MPTKTRRRPAKRIAEALKIQLDITSAGLQGRVEQFSFEPKDEHLQSLVALAELFDKRAAAVASDKNLSAVSRDNALLSVARETHAAVVLWEEENVESIDASIADKTAALQREQAGDKSVTLSDPTEALLRELRHGEIRRSLAGLDPLEVQALYFEAPEEVRDAIETALPRVVKTVKGTELLPLVPADIINQRALGAAAITDPEAQAQILARQRYRDANASLASTLKGALRDAAPGRIDTADPIADQAAGTTG